MSSEVPRPRTEEELVGYLRDLVGGELDYSSSADALWKGATAAFEYLAYVVGASGFQASWAGLHILREINRYKGPFGIVNAEDMVYPQYKRPSEVALAWEEEWKPWVAQRARELLAEHDFADQRVREHWERLASEVDAV